MSSLSSIRSMPRKAAIARAGWLFSALIYGVLAVLIPATAPTLPSKVRSAAVPVAWLCGGIAFLAGIAYRAFPSGIDDSWLELHYLEREPVIRSAFVVPASRRNIRMGIKRNSLAVVFGIYLLLVPVPPELSPASLWPAAIEGLHLAGALVVMRAVWALRTGLKATAAGWRDLALLPAGLFVQGPVGRAWIIPWDVIESISLAGSKRQKEYGLSLLCIRIADLSQVTFSPPRSFRFPRRRFTRRFSTALFALRDTDLERVIHHYLAHPEDRDEIGTAEGLSQITGLFRPGEKAGMVS
jgi:hypothetical protein